jgi:hypothetical protein
MTIPIVKARRMVIMDPLRRWTNYQVCQFTEFYGRVLDSRQSDEGEAHLHELSQLAQKDPEFYKYLQENDRELLEFNPSAKGGDDVMEGVEGARDDDDDVELEETPILTKDVLKNWQKALLEVILPPHLSLSRKSHILILTATLTPCAPKVARGLPLRCAHSG